MGGVQNILSDQKQPPPRAHDAWCVSLNSDDADEEGVALLSTRQRAVQNVVALSRCFVENWQACCVCLLEEVGGCKKKLGYPFTNNNQRFLSLSPSLPRPSPHQHSSPMPGTRGNKSSTRERQRSRPPWSASQPARPCALESPSRTFLRLEWSILSFKSLMKSH